MASLLDALAARDPAASRLLPARFDEEEAWIAAAEAARRPIAPALVEEIARQQEALGPSPSRRRSLEALAAGAPVVVTGQQVGLFLGPLYTVHKAATAIARARLVAERTGRPCVPLFWLQTEDHDYAEIARCEVLAPSGRIPLALPDERADEARVSIAHRALPPEVAELVARLVEALAPLPHGGEVSSLLARAWVPGRPIAEAFARTIAELFDGEGLLVFDPRVPAAARLAAPILRRAIVEQAAIAADLDERAAALAAGGFDEQVRTRDDAALVFFHPRGPEGPRYRLARAASGWSTPEGPVDESRLLDLLEREPLRFSTSALLRPIVEDALLPTCAYLGGPGEIAYFAQLPPLYVRFGVPMPLVAPRARLRVVEPPARALLERLGLAPADLDQPRDALLARLSARPPALAALAPDGDALRARLLGDLDRALDELSRIAPSLDPALADPIRRTRETCAHGVSRLVERVERAARERDKIAADRLDRLREQLRPDGAPQERVYNFAGPAARVGARAFVSSLVAACAPLSSAVRDVSP